jgi:hypothetical protein
MLLYSIHFGYLGNVERFTYKPSSTDGGDGITFPPRLPPEIQYWAGFIMQNSCRKDDRQSGIQKCANGSYAFAPSTQVCVLTLFRSSDLGKHFHEISPKFRRCGKAKYCGKECQSTAWSEEHRFWYSAKDIDDDHHHIMENVSTTLRSTGRIPGDCESARRRPNIVATRNMGNMPGPSGISGSSPSSTANGLWGLDVAVVPPSPTRMSAGAAMQLSNCMNLKFFYMT